MNTAKDTAKVTKPIAKNIIFDSWVKKILSLLRDFRLFFFSITLFRTGRAKKKNHITVMQISILQCTRKANKRKQDAILNKTIKLVFMMS